MARKTKAKSQKKSGKAKVSGVENAPVKVAEEINKNLPVKSTEPAIEQEAVVQDVAVSDFQPASVVADHADSTVSDKQQDKDETKQVETVSAEVDPDKSCAGQLSIAENSQNLKNSADSGDDQEKDQKKKPAAESQKSGKQKKAVSGDKSVETVNKVSVVGNGYVSRTVCAFLTVFALILGIFIGTLIPQEQAHKASGSADSLAKGDLTAQSAPVNPESVENASKTNGKADSVPPMPRELAQKMAELEKAVVANPSDASLWTGLGNLYFDSGQSKKAIDAYEKSLSLAPGNPDIMTDLGIMYRESGDYEKAVAQFRAVSAIVPSHQNALFNEGVVLYYDMGQKDAAIAAWQKLLKVNPQAKGPDGQSVSEMIKHLH